MTSLEGVVGTDEDQQSVVGERCTDHSKTVVWLHAAPRCADHSPGYLTDQLNHRPPGVRHYWYHWQRTNRWYGRTQRYLITKHELQLSVKIWQSSGKSKLFWDSGYYYCHTNITARPSTTTSSLLLLLTWIKMSPLAMSIWANGLMNKGGCLL